MKSEYKILVAKPEEKGAFATPECDWEDN